MNPGWTEDTESRFVLLTICILFPGCHSKIDYEFGLWWIAEALDKGWMLIFMDRISSLQEKCRCPRVGRMQRIPLWHWYFIGTSSEYVSSCYIRAQQWWTASCSSARWSCRMSCNMECWYVSCPRTLTLSNPSWCKEKRAYTSGSSYISYWTSEMCPDSRRISVR